MSEAETSPDGGWQRAGLVAALFAVDPPGLGGVALSARAGPVREAWLQLARTLAGDGPFRRLPLNASDDRLLGGLDLALTLKHGRPIAERGLLADADGGIVLVASAERVDTAKAARLTAVMDRGRLVVERDGFAFDAPARFGVIALDESVAEDEHPPRALLDRLAFRVPLDGIKAREAVSDPELLDMVGAARARLSRTIVTEAAVEALCAAALALGVASARAPILAVAAARAAAALDGSPVTTGDHITLAATLVLAPRATRLPVAPEDEEMDAGEEQPPPPDEAQGGEDQLDPETLADIVLEAAQAAIPPGLLAKLRDERERRGSGPQAGKAGEIKASKLRGRPAGVIAGRPRDGARLSVIDTLRAAAPWQTLRRRDRQGRAPMSGDIMSGLRRIEVRAEDFRIARYKHRTETATIFVVDASGSSALHRLAEAKGAVELLLADCYVRRDCVALIAFRGKDAELILPPTRSLARAKRCLAGMPGGGGTPLATAVAAAVELAEAVKRKGQTPAIVLLTDGRANIARDGRPGRPAAESDALAAAKAAALSGITALVLDTSPKPQKEAERLAQAMGAGYLPLPHANAQLVSQAVRLATEPARSPQR